MAIATVEPVTQPRGISEGQKSLTPIEFSSHRQTEQIVTDMTRSHHEFQRKWGKPAYHDDTHISATLLSTDKMVEGMKAGVDIFNTQQDLERWNAQNPDNQIKSLGEFAEVLHLTFAMHDIGNIAKPREQFTPPTVQDVAAARVAIETLANTNDTSLPYDYLDKYDSKGAEDRAVQIMRSVLADHPNREKYSPLIRHLILASKMDADETAPFVALVHVIDQIGANVLAKNADGSPMSRNEITRRVMHEFASEEKDVVTADGSWNFVPRKIRDWLLPKIKDKSAMPQVVERPPIITYDQKKQLYDVLGVFEEEESSHVDFPRNQMPTVWVRSKHGFTTP